jgi:hypothetical protein
MILHKDPEFQKLLEEELERRHLCPRCGRTVPPKDLAGEELFCWLLDNDSLVRLAYEVGWHEAKFSERD